MRAREINRLELIRRFAGGPEAAPCARASARGRLGYVNAGGIILETFFLSNPHELAVYLARCDDLARALAETLSEVAP